MDGGDQAGFGVVGGHVGEVLDVWPNEVVQRVQIGGGGGPVREGYKVVALLLKSSLGLFRLVARRRVLLPHPGSVTGYLIAPGDHHIQVHFGVDFLVDFEDVRWHDVALTWNHTKDHNRCRKLGFHHPGHIPVIHGNPDLNSEYSFSETSCLTKTEESRLLFTHSWRENNWIHIFPKGISAMWNAISLVQDWTRVAVSIAYDNNHYTIGTSFKKWLHPHGSILMK